MSIDEQLTATNSIRTHVRPNSPLGGCSWLNSEMEKKKEQTISMFSAIHRVENIYIYI